LTQRAKIEKIDIFRGNFQNSNPNHKCLTRPDPGQKFLTRTHHYLRPPTEVYIAHQKSHNILMKMFTFFHIYHESYFKLVCQSISHFLDFFFVPTKFLPLNRVPSSKWSKDTISLIPPFCCYPFAPFLDLKKTHIRSINITVFSWLGGHHHVIHRVSQDVIELIRLCFPALVGAPHLLVW